MPVWVYAISVSALSYVAKLVYAKWNLPVILLHVLSYTLTTVVTIHFLLEDGLLTRACLERLITIFPRLCLFVPCYNEEDVLPSSIPELRQTLIDMVGEGLIQATSFMLLVNDGSIDSTWSIINQVAEDTAEAEQARVTGLSLTRNRGHQNALIAGLDMAKRLADVAISIDCDLQDDTRVMHDMILKYLDGADIVYGVRYKRDSDTTFKRQSAQGYYRLMKLLGVELIYNHKI